MKKNKITEVKKLLLAIIIIFLVIIVLYIAIYFLYNTSEPPKTNNNQSQPLSEQEVMDKYGKLPLMFEENTGQVSDPVKFIVKSGSTTIFFTPEEIVYTIVESKPKDRKRPRELTEPTDPDEQESTRGVVIRQKFSDANTSLNITGEDLLSSKVNYFIGSNPDDWQSEISTYGKISYKNLYDGIDLAYTGNNSQLIYSYTIFPGKDYSQIKLKLEGNTGLNISEDGSLVITTELKNFGLMAPRAYQERNGQKIDITADYLIFSDNTYGFKIGNYDPTFPLIINQLL